MKNTSKAAKSKAPSVNRQGKNDEGSMVDTAPPQAPIRPATPERRKRIRRTSAAEGSGSSVPTSPSVPLAKKARTGDHALVEPSTDIAPASPSKKKNARKKERAQKKKATQAETTETVGHNEREPVPEEDEDQAEGDRPVPNPTPAMSDVRSQLPPSSFHLNNPRPTHPNLTSAQDIISSGNQEQLPMDALRSLSKMWEELTNPKESLFSHLEGRQDPAETEAYHKKAYKGRVLLDWLHENTWAIKGVVNNRGTMVTHAKAILKSMKAFGHQGAKHPIIVIVREADLPTDIEWSESSPPSLTFSSKTAVGIVAGAHRLLALRMFCEEADTLIKAAKEYLEELDQRLLGPGAPMDDESDLRSSRDDIKQTLDRLVKERDAVAHWPTLIYDWELILAQTPQGRRLRDELSLNFTLAHRDANAPERLSQIWRLSDKHGREGQNMLKPGPEKILWKCTETWRPFLGHLSQFPAFQSEITGQVARYAPLASAHHWPGAAIFVLLHCLSGLETLFEPVDDLPDGLDLPPEYWKQLLTPSLAKTLGEILKSNGRDLIESGKIQEWRQKHAEAYWNGVEDALTTHFRPVDESRDMAVFHNTLSGVLQERLKVVRKQLVLPLYTKELRQIVFAWFQLAGPALYAIADMIDANWRTFSSKSDMFSYGDAGSHIVRCLQARAILRPGGGTQDIRDLDIRVCPSVHIVSDKRLMDLLRGKLTRYIVKGLYEPAWIQLSVWLALRKHSDPVNGVMTDAMAMEGVVELSSNRMKAVMSLFKGLKQLTGLQDPSKDVMSIGQILNEALHAHRTEDEQESVEKAHDWWVDWTRLGHVALREDWAAPLSQDAITRMAASFERTTSPPKIWEKISKRPEFSTIFAIFRHVPDRRNTEEQLLGWAFQLPWDSQKQESLGRRSFNLDTPHVHSHRATCVLAYSPMEFKGKGKKGGLPKVVTSLDQLPQSKIALDLDPFGAGIPVAPGFTFWAYMQTNFFHPRMWPTYKDWPRLKGAMAQWQALDLEWLEVVWEDKDQALCNEKLARNLWDFLNNGWEVLAFWCLAELVHDGGMRDEDFPLPSLLNARLSLVDTFYELRLFRQATDYTHEEEKIALPAHLSSSDTLHVFVRTFFPDIDPANFVAVDPSEEEFRRVGIAWMLVRHMRPRPKVRFTRQAVRFTLFVRETLGTWPTKEGYISTLLKLYDDPQYAAVAALSHDGDAFRKLWPLVSPEQESSSPHERDLEQPPFTPFRAASFQQEEESHEGRFVQGANAPSDEDEVPMEQDQEMAGATPPPDSKPRLADVQDRFQDMELDEIDFPSQPAVLVPESSQAPRQSQLSGWVETPPPLPPKPDFPKGLLAMASAFAPTGRLQRLHNQQPSAKG
ncbi:hypothetical protein FRC01_012974 [Tulasnella sp. 417]|nr:hypothetical protein FRC01_012974 [Tulasnella sp. 417]